MAHANFLIWMIGFPVSQCLIEIARWRWGEPVSFSVEERGIAALILIAIWLIIGVVLY